MAKAPSKKAKCGKKGFIHMKNDKMLIHVNGKTYFVNIKTLENVLNGTNKKGAYILGYD